MDSFLVPAGFGEAEFTEKHSRFIGRIWPAETEKEALDIIKSVREKHWDATHNVFAYIINEGNYVRFSDDGEPSGTSGMPTLNVLQGRNLTNCCCVITRYFGGILLGTGGLVRAYSQAAAMAVEAAGISRISRFTQFIISCSYAQYELTRSVIMKYGGTVDNVDYGAELLFTAAVPEYRFEEFSHSITERSAGTIEVKTVGTVMRGEKIK